MPTKEQFEKGTGDWDKLFGFMNENNFTILDFLACICTNLLDRPDNEFKTTIMLNGVIFEIEIKKDVN